MKYGFEDLIAHSTLRNLIPEKKRLSWKRGDRPVLQYSRWERVRMAAEELGPTFVKLAQILSIRPDIIPDPLIKELEKLQDRVPPFEYEKVRQIFKSETGKEIEEIFDEFSVTPVASASIGQVHKAKLKNGAEVVVKVQRPGVKEQIECDLSILKEAVDRTERYLKRQGLLNPHEVVRAFERAILKELDYRNEARNIQKFREFYKNYTNFYVHKVFREFSTEKILVIEYIPGCKINDVAQLKEWGLNPQKIAENGMLIYLTQIFEYGYFHADPHPGNVFVRKDGVICLLDFGMVGRLMEKDKYAFAWIFISLAKGDVQRMAANLRKLAVSDEIKDMRAFQYDLNDLIEDYADLDVSESSIAEMTTRLQKIMYEYRISVPGGIYLIFRAFTILEGIGKQVHPHFNTYNFIKPYGAKLIEQQFSAKSIWNEIAFKAEQVNDMLTSFPRDMKDLIDKIRKGKLRFEVEHQGYGYLLKKLDILTNRLILSLLICALLIGSAIAMKVQFPPQYINQYGIPVVSVTGLFIAGGLFVILFYSIIRRSKYK